jgi:rod shape-determining protein MreC
VINNSTNRKNNYLTLNIGSAQGVKEGDGVIASQGAVGIVRAVSDNFSSVMSCLHMNVRIPVVIKKYNEFSILQWDGKSEEYSHLSAPVPSHLNISKGDTVVTSGSAIFPEGIMVGTIESFQKVVGNTFYDVTIKLSTDFSQLKYVTVVHNLLREEQMKLEQSSQHD